MKKFMLICSVLLASFLILGCPASTRFPLGEPGTVPINKDLVGIWETSDEYEVQKIEFIENDPYSYLIKVLTSTEKYIGDQYYVGYLTNIGTKNYLYARPLGSGGDEVNYYYFKIDITKNTLTTREVTFADSTISSTAQLREYFSSHQHTDASFFSGITLWIKDAKIFFINLYGAPFDVRLGENSKPVFTMSNLPSNTSSQLLQTTDLEENFLYYKPSSQTDWKRWRDVENIPYACPVEGGKIHAIIAKPDGTMRYYMLEDDSGYNPKVTMLNGTVENISMMKIGKNWEFDIVAFIDDLTPFEMTNFKAIPQGNYGLFWLPQGVRKSGYYFLPKDSSNEVTMSSFDPGKYYLFLVFSENSIIHAELFDITSPW